MILVMSHVQSVAAEHNTSETYIYIYIASFLPAGNSEKDSISIYIATEETGLDSKHLGS